MMRFCVKCATRARLNTWGKHEGCPEVASAATKHDLVWRVNALEAILEALAKGDYRHLSMVAEDYQISVDAVVQRLRGEE